MKRLYIICFVTLILLFGSCYCIGYYAIINNSEEPTSAVDYYEFREASAINEPVIKRETKIIIEEYNIETLDVTEYTIEPDIALLGLQRAQLMGRINDYVEAPDEADVERGFVTAELIEFGSTQVIIRKSYDTPDYSTTGNFILCEADGKVVIYYEDFMTIYDYTDIDVTGLPLELQKEIYIGKQIKTIEELYEFLEEHTS